MEELSAGTSPRPLRNPRGYHATRVDPTGRLKLPARFVDYIRAQPDQVLFATVVKDLAKIYVNGAWERELDKLRADEADIRDRIERTAEALGGCVALAWKGELFKELARHDPGLGMKMTELMYGHLEEMQDRFRELATERVERRVARALLRLGAQGEHEKADGPPFDIALSRQEIAEMTGTTLFTVSRLLSEWERQGVVVGGREHIVILSTELLRAIAEDSPPQG